MGDIEIQEDLYEFLEPVLEQDKSTYKDFNEVSRRLEQEYFGGEVL